MTKMWRFFADNPVVLVIIAFALLAVVVLTK
jgi:hypothetical protein